MGRVADGEAAVVTREDERLGAERLGEGARGAGGDRLPRLLPHGEDQTVPRGAQRLEVRLVGGHGRARPGQQRVLPRAVVLVGQAELGGIGQGPGEELLGELALPHAHGEEGGEPRAPAALLIGAADGVVRALGELRVGQHAHDGRLMGDDPADVLGMRREQGERGDGAAAAGEHLHRRAEIGDQDVEVLRLQGRVVQGAAVAAGAPAESARVVRDDGAVRELGDQVGEAVGGHGLADDQQHLSPVGRGQRAVHVVDDLGVGQGQGAGLHGHSVGPCPDEEKGDRRQVRPAVSGAARTCARSRTPGGPGAVGRERPRRRHPCRLRSR